MTVAPDDARRRASDWGTLKIKKRQHVINFLVVSTNSGLDKLPRGTTILAKTSSCKIAFFKNCAY